MNFIELAKKRYACRDFCDKPVLQPEIDRILEAARVAPTGANRQPQVLIVVQGDALKKLSNAANIYGAPLAVIVCGDTKKAWVRPIDKKQILDIDTTIVTDHMMLQATDLGLDTLWVCSFNPAVLSAEFEFPSHLVPVNILAIGYAKGVGEPSDRHLHTRKPLNETVIYTK